MKDPSLYFVAGAVLGIAIGLIATAMVLAWWVP